MGLTGNKGEWSELYVLLKLLGEKKIHAGDGDLNKLEAYYPILQIIRDELSRHMTYDIDSDIVIIKEDNSEVTRIPVSEFLKQSEELFRKIQNGGYSAGAFEIPSMEKFLNKIHCQKIKAKSQDKSDIHIVIHDYHTGMKPDLGFSIKSAAGAAATLLNASAATVFKYEIVGGEMSDEYISWVNSIDTKKKMQDRVNALCEHGCKFKFSGVPHPVFNGNLQMIDSHLSEIVGWMLADSYANRDTDIQHAVKRISTSNPMRYNLTEGHDFYGYKIKSLMVAVALGMLPGKAWSGRYEATGGYIVVRGDGDVICFHIYDRNLLEDYLVKNTKFETPDFNRYPIGEIYEADGKYYFNLGLQIRFK